MREALYYIRWCTDCRRYGEPEFTKGEEKIEASSDEEAVGAFEAWVREHPPDPRTPYSQKPFLDKIVCIATASA